MKPDDLSNLGRIPIVSEENNKKERRFKSNSGMDDLNIHVRRSSLQIHSFVTRYFKVGGAHEHSFKTKRRERFYADFNTMFTFMIASDFKRKFWWIWRYSVVTRWTVSVCLWIPLLYLLTRSVSSWINFHRLLLCFRVPMFTVLDFYQHMFKRLECCGIFRGDEIFARYLISNISPISLLHHCFSIQTIEILMIVMKIQYDGKWNDMCCYFVG